MKIKFYKAILWLLNAFTGSNVFFIYTLFIIFRMWKWGIDTRLLLEVVIICFLIIANAILDIAEYCKKTFAIYEEAELRNDKDFVAAVAKQSMADAITHLNEQSEKSKKEFNDFHGDNQLN